MDTPKPSRRPKNKAEAAVFDILTGTGWTVTKRGWPDFACYKDGKFITVEVKGRRSQRLKGHQRAIMQQLSKQGVLCYRYDPEQGFLQIHPDVPT